MKQTEIDMLIYSMGEIERYGLPDLQTTAQNQREPSKFLTPMDDLLRELLSDIIFVNGAYDSRKTGISALRHSPSTFRLYIGPEFLSFICNQINTQQHRHFPIQLAFNFEEPFQLSIDGSKEFRLFFFLIPTDTPHKLISTEGKHLTILVDPLSLLGRKLRTLFEHQDTFVSFSKSIIDSIYGYVDPGVFESETAHLLSTILACLNEMISELPESSMDNRIRETIAHCRAKGGRELDIAALPEGYSFLKVGLDTFLKQKQV